MIQPQAPRCKVHGVEVDVEGARCYQCRNMERICPDEKGDAHMFWVGIGIVMACGAWAAIWKW